MIFKSKKNKKTLIYNIRVFLLLLAVVVIWRGIWNIFDRYFFPDYFVLSNLLSIVIGLVIIFINDYELEDLV
ncbi:MAG: hypothetical protein PHI37_02290 [Candidatus Gracilibacteria bacterium]|nr:hypothetical protein [Candidatus Gracilibacteria bacterium]